MDKNLLRNTERRAVSKVIDVDSRIKELSKKWYEKAIEFNSDTKEFIENHPIDDSETTPWSKILAYQS